MKRLSVYLGVMIFLFTIVPIFGQQTVKIASFPIPLMVESPTQGIFVELTLEIARRADVSIIITVLPPMRTISEFESLAIDCVFPALDPTMPGPVAKSTPIYNKVDYVFYLKTAPLKTLKDLEGKRVGLTRGYPYSKELTENKKIIISYVDSDVANMKMLGAGRIDAFVVEEKSGLSALAQSEQTNIAYDPKQFLSSLAVYYAFHATEQGKILAEKFSKALQSMQADGSFAALMAKAK